MHRDRKKRDDELGLAGLGPSSQRSAAHGPLLLGQIVAVIVSDLGAGRLNYCMPAMRSVSERKAR
jgi:hypothetical protein